MSEEKDDRLTGAGTHDEEGAQDGLPNEEFNNLLESINTMAPLLKGLLGGNADASPTTQKREQLLLALKPYVSSARCEAIDYLIRIGRIGDAIRHLQ